MADNLSILDSTGTAKTVRTTDTASVHVPHHIVDSVTGTVTVAGTGTFVTQSVVTNAASDFSSPIFDTITGLLVPVTRVT